MSGRSRGSSSVVEPHVATMSYWDVGEGKRARKTVETLTVADHREGKEVVIQEGKGTPLGEMEGVVEGAWTRRGVV